MLAVGQDLGDLGGEDRQVLDLLPQRVDVLELHEVGVPLDLEHLPLRHLQLLAQVRDGALHLLVLFLRMRIWNQYRVTHQVVYKLSIQGLCNSHTGPESRAT